MSGRRQFAREIRGVALEITYLPLQVLAFATEAHGFVEQPMDIRLVALEITYPPLQVLAFATEAHHAFEQIRCPGFCGAGEIAVSLPVGTERAGVRTKVDALCVSLLKPVKKCLPALFVGTSEQGRGRLELRPYIVQRVERLSAPGCAAARERSERVAGTRHPIRKRLTHSNSGLSRSMVAEVRPHELLDGIGGDFERTRPLDPGARTNSADLAPPVAQEIAILDDCPRDHACEPLGVEHVPQPHEQGELRQEAVAFGERRRNVGRVPKDQNAHRVDPVLTAGCAARTARTGTCAGPSQQRRTPFRTRVRARQATQLPSRSRQATGPILS